MEDEIDGFAKNEDPRNTGTDEVVAASMTRLLEFRDWHCYRNGTRAGCMVWLMIGCRARARARVPDGKMAPLGRTAVPRSPKVPRSTCWPLRHAVCTRVHLLAHGA